MSAVAATPVAARTDEVRRLQAFLAESGFDARGVRELLHAGDELLSTSLDLPIHVRRLADRPSRLATLVELLVLGVPVPRQRAEEHLAPLGLELVAELGLLEVADEVRAGVRLVPHDELLVASDPPSDRQPDHVAGVHRPSATLAHLTMRLPVGRALDVGTGNGIQGSCSLRTRSTWSRQT